MMTADDLGSGERQDAGRVRGATARPAIFPMHPRFAPHVDVCVVIRDGKLEFVARDVLEAIGWEAGVYESDPSHAAPTSFTEHAKATTWSRETIADLLEPIDDRDVLRDFNRWLDARIGDLARVGFDVVERTTLYGTGQRIKPAEPDAPIERSLPEYYSVAATAKILSRDPGIGKIGRDALFEHLHKTAWIERIGTTWKPAHDLIVIGYLTRLDVKIPQHDEPYPQVCITALGIEALHKRLGGTAELILDNRSHLTLIGTES
jgi:hypothetical protein